jgi:hypothetical protein
VKQAKEPRKRGNFSGAGRQAAKTREVRWVESDELLDDLGHGVQFFHDELRQPEYVVAFLEGFGWRGGGSATVRFPTIRPSFITPNRWSEIIESTREGVLAFLSDEGNLNHAFRHGPIQILING